MKPIPFFLQIIGFTNCSETRKAIRFCKERSIPFQFLDLSEKTLSKGELESIIHHVPIDSLINTENSLYKKLNLQCMDISPMEIIEQHPRIIKTPIIRINKKKVFIGFTSDVEKEIILLKQ